MITAIALPVVGLAAVGGVQMAYVASIRANTQAIADSTAIMAAQQIGVESTGAANRAQAWALGQLASLPGKITYAVSSALVGDNAVEVTITANVPSFFGSELPVGGFPTTVKATAQSLGQAPLCVLVTATQAGDDIRLKNQSQMNSSCLVYSDSDVKVDGGASLTAPSTEVVTSAQGSVTAPAQTGAVNVTDPFAAMNTAFPLPCLVKAPPLVISANTILPSGVVVCSDVEVRPGVTLTLAPGQQYFNYNLKLGAGSILTGSDVVLFFGPTTTLNFDDASSVALAGRKSGPYAGFVLVTSRAATGMFAIPSNPFSAVTGTIYSPSAGLQVQGSKQAAQASDWTVIVARSLELTGSPNLKINANYATSSVPTPNGVGPIPAGSRLVQ